MQQKQSKDYAQKENTHNPREHVEIRNAPALLYATDEWTRNDWQNIDRAPICQIVLQLTTFQMLLPEWHATLRTVACCSFHYYTWRNGSSEATRTVCLG